MEVVSSDPVDRQILEITGAAQRRQGSCVLGEIVAQLRGVERERIVNALEIMEDRGWLGVRQSSRVPRSRRFDPRDSLVSLTTRGKDVLRRLRASAQLNVRLPGSLDRELREHAERIGATVSELAVRFIDEGLRMTRFPGVDFRVTATGRVPHVTGTGLSVWELYQLWLDRDKDAVRVAADYPSLRAAQVNAAVAYGSAYAHEMPPRSGRPAFAREVAV